MTIVTDRQEIADLLLRFRETLCSKLKHEVPASVGSRAGSMDTTLRWSDDVQMWMTYDDAHDKEIGRFWTAFGLDKPFKDQNMSITVEINFPVKGLDRRIGGAFIRTPQQGIIVVHNGKIGGGRPGIGKSLFLDNYRGTRLTVIDGDRETDFASIGELESSRFAYEVRDFVAEVERIKRLR